MTAAIIAALAGGSFWLGARAGVSDERAGTVVAGLLHNVYRAFDYRDEERIDVVELSAEPGGAGGFVATVLWHVTGSVGHWGHIHQRKNRYRARLDVRPAQSAWKLTGLEILEEARLSDAGPGG